MAIDINNARFLIALKRNGIDFNEVATIGRQGLFIPTKLISDLFSEGGVAPDKQAQLPDKDMIDFSEPFFQQLGAKDIATIDFSDYEGATVIHDMNTPVPAKMQERYRVLIDSGSLEHIFNFPQAIHNYMKMVKTGGYLVLVNMPVNNHAGHGFFQFSPELFFNLLVPANGFELKSLMIASDEPFSKFYSVTSPQKANSRIELVGEKAMMLFLVAKKIGNVEQITTPVQNDYSIAWTKGNAHQTTQKVRSLKQRVIGIARQLSLRTYFVFSIQRNEKVRRRRFALTNSALYSEVQIERWKMSS